MTDDLLATLRPLHAPPRIPWWPPAPGWWIVLSLAILALVIFIGWRRRGVMQRAALHELRSLASLTDHPVVQAAAVNRLLKRFVRVRWPNTEAASLTGEAWLNFLDTHGGGESFTRGAGRVLGTLPYGDTTVEVGNGDELIATVHRWIRSNGAMKGR